MHRSLALLLVISACSDSTSIDIPEVRSDLDRELAPNVTPTQLETLVSGNRAFAADLYGAVRSEPGNLFMSPHSISTALAMTYAGARSTTATQMAEALHFTLPEAELHAAFNKLDLELASRGEAADSDTIPFQLTAANALFGQTGMELLTPFLDTLARNYGAGLRVLDFVADHEGARETINEWVEDRTNDKIEDLLPQGSITPNTRLVLANAIYFSAAWAEPFEASKTADRPFTLASGETIDVPSLHQSALNRYGAGPDYRAGELAYDGGQLSMVVVVPDDLAAFEDTLDGQRLAEIVAGLSGSLLEITLPKFEFAAPLGLVPALMSLGMIDAFSPAADFSGIDGTRSLAISDVLHKGFISIDENGTEAAAATAVIIGETSVPTPATLVVDRPFLFMIVDRPTGAILFLGRVVDPR